MNTRQKTIDLIENSKVLSQAEKEIAINSIETIEYFNDEFTEGAALLLNFMWQDTKERTNFWKPVFDRIQSELIEAQQKSFDKNTKRA